MARTVPGSGAVIEPLFNKVFGIKAVKVIEGGKEYESADPPRLTITGCGTPTEEALLYPIIDDESGKIIHVRVLEPGLGYDPLRVSITPLQDTPNVVTSFDINRIWQSNPNSSTTGSFATDTDRLTIQTDGDPKPSNITTENLRVPGGGSTLTDDTFNQQFIYRGGKEVPNPALREFQRNKSVGVMANGVLLHTPEWGALGGAPTNFDIDTVKHGYLKSSDEFDGVIDTQQYYYQSSKLINQLAQDNGAFENGFIRPFTWKVKTETDNIMLNVVSTEENNGGTPIEVGRTVSVINGDGVAEIAKVVRDAGGVCTRVYLRLVGGTFSSNDRIIGSNGFYFTISGNPLAFPTGIFYIEFGPDAAEFGNFTPGEYYFAPEDIKVQRNYLIIWDQSDASNQAPMSHPMRFSTTADGTHNAGAVYYNSTGASGAPAADYENEYQALFIMNADETSRIYYYCAYHTHMSGYTGNEGYITFDSEIDNDPLPNDYYITDFYDDGGTPDYSRHANGHSKILGMSFDGYPIYGPYGYTNNTTIGRMTSSFRLKTGVEVDGNRPPQTTTGSVTHTITVSNGKFLIDGQLLEVLNLDRGKTYTFNLDDSSNDGYIGLFSTTEDGWHSTGQSTDIGDTSYLFSSGIKYFINGLEVQYQSYISGFTTATTRSIQYESKVDAPTVIYAFSYSGTEVGYRLVNNGYVMGDFTQDYIYEEGLGLLDEQNGIFASTPEYPNGTYCYFMTEDSSGNPVYPYIVGPKLYGAPTFEGDTLPTASTEFPFGAEGKVNINDGAIDFIKMVKTGDGYFGPTQATILGGEGTGATVTPTVQTVTGLTLLTDGRNFLTPPSLIFEGGGGQGATGAASIDVTGKITNISVVDPGEFYDEAPYILITGGGGLGAKAVARISQGSVIGVDIVDPGRGYTTEPNVIFQKLVDLKRKARARQSQASESFFLTGLLKAVTANDDTLYVKSTNAFPGSGSIIVDQETISYASKSEQKFTGLTRGVNFRYDQRVVLDTSQNDSNQVSTYTYNVGDRVIRSIENSNNKIAKVYDWNPYNRELLVTFEVDELAFIDAGIPSTEDTIVQFDAGTPGSASSSFQPHVIVNSVGDEIVALTVPISTLSDKKFEDDDEQDGLGDGIPDLVNTGTAYVNQINLDGGIHSSLYGVEETQGGQNTTLFQVGESLKDGSTPLKFASVIEAGALNEGRPHNAIVEIFVDPLYGNGLNFSVNEVVTGQYSQIQATVVSWDNARSVLTVKDIVPYDTGDVNVGTNGKLYSFSENSTVTDFIVLDPGADYTQIPTIAVEDIGDVQATGTVNMTTAGDQIASVTITNGGYGIVPYVDGTYNLHPTITVTNGGGDTTGSGAILQAVTSGENIVGNGGASYKIKSINYQTQIRS